MIPTNFPGKNPMTGINIGKPDTPSGKAKVRQAMVSPGQGVKIANGVVATGGTAPQSIKKSKMPTQTMPGVKKRIR